jgi:hypothetical protein
VMPSMLWVASTKPESPLVRREGRDGLFKGEGGLWRRVVAGQRAACIA